MPTTVGDKPGVALADQVKSLDWRARKAKKAGAVDQAVFDDILAKIQTLLS
ncbi:MAG: type II toxin-antitoxin system PemK/MazF family toxin [bacterium]|nr:type II toxin-antitoxin system PemK/MazF family toxin [bacterium]